MELINEYFKFIPNIYFLVIITLIFLLINEFKFSSKNLKEKITISYALLIVLKYLNLISIRFIILISMFLYFFVIELINNKDNKLPIYGVVNYLLDYLFKLFFKYNYAGFIISLIIVSNKSMVIFTKIFGDLGNNIIVILSAITYLITVNSIYKNKFNTLSLDEIKDKMNEIIPFQDYQHDKRLEDFAEILTYYEDKSYFSRNNSYNWISCEFIKYKYKRVKSNQVGWLYNISIIGEIFRNIATTTQIVYKLISRIYKIFIKCFKIILKVLRKKKKIYTIRSIIRGYSTIEMQLIRTIALKDGYRLIFHRKIYELIYSNLFFKSLKEYYKYYRYNNTREYKYYLLEIYINVAPSFINGKKYRSIKELCSDRENILEIPNEEFFLYVLGLANRTFDKTNIVNYYCPIELDYKLLILFTKKLLDNVDYIPDEYGIGIKLMLTDNLKGKKFPIELYFEMDRKFEDIRKYIKDCFCIKRDLEVYVENLIEVLYDNCLSEKAFELLDINYLELIKIVDKVKISELLDICNHNIKTINITYNVEIGIGKAYGEEDGIKYRFHNNEKSIHNDIPHIHCKYGKEEIRIKLLDCNIMDNKSFKSPTKTKKARRYVKKNQKELLEIWENVVDKDNVLNKKILKSSKLRS